jgi:hypothetical protein
VSKLADQVTQVLLQILVVTQRRCSLVRNTTQGEQTYTFWCVLLVREASSAREYCGTLAKAKFTFEDFVHDTLPHKRH